MIAASLLPTTTIFEQLYGRPVTIPKLLYGNAIKTSDTGILRTYSKTLDPRILWKTINYLTWRTMTH